MACAAMISIVYMSVLEEASPAVEYAERLRPLPSARHSSAVFNFSPGLGRGLVCFLLHVARSLSSVSYKSVSDPSALSCLLSV